MNFCRYILGCHISPLGRFNLERSEVIFVQGDLNSRTVFDHHEIGSQAKDVLLEAARFAAGRGKGSFSCSGWEKSWP